MENNKVVVVSTVDGIVSIHSPEYRVSRTWSKKGAKVTFDKEVLAEVMYAPGVSSMFNKGILYIEDMDTKKELGLEPEEATEPENIIVLNENQMKRYLTVAPIFELEAILNKLSGPQKKNLVDYAVKNEIVDMDKADIIKKHTGMDIINLIRIHRDVQ